MDGVGVDTTLFPESIPHLFHQDLVYLWILEAHNRPNSWQERVRAWRCLVELLLTGELTVVPQELQRPLLDYTSPYGVDRIQWVCLKNTDEIIGVLSPTVLVRPLPFEDPPYVRPVHLQSMEQRRSDKQSPSVFRHFVQLAVSALERGQPEASLRVRLSKILIKEFGPQVMATPPSSSSLPIRVLDRIVWSQQGLGSTALQQLDILVPGRAEKVYVPLCQKCKAPLPKNADAPPIPIESGQFQIYCAKADCAAENTLDLHDFLIWIRNNKNVVVWDKEGVLPMPAKGFPPTPVPGDGEILFEWDPAQLEGEREKRFLKLSFQDRKISPYRIDSVFFTKVILSGELTSFSGLPVRYEWRDALSQGVGIEIESEVDPLKVSYRNIQLNGLPVAINRVFPSLSIHSEPSLSVGVYPDPRLVPSEWKWHRLFLSGPNRNGYRIEIDNTVSTLPWLVETTTGFDNNLFFSISAASNPNTGVSFSAEVTHRRRSGTEATRIPLGIDFGTTNTIVYFRPPDKDMAAVVAQPRSYCLEPRLLADCVKWMAQGEQQEPDLTGGDFLPASTYGMKRVDPYLIPSGLWSFDSRFLIRWESLKPHEHADALRNFKWDSGPGSSERREGFLLELLLVALPSILKRTLGTAPAPQNLTFNLGFAFPLAFGKDARDSMQSAWDRVKSRLEEYTGFNYEIHALNESLACTEALQQSLTETQTFLVADMGGGTIDLALFIGTSDVPEQIGSIKFAGETYVDVLVAKRGLGAQDLRDLIFRGECYTHYGGDGTANTILQRFIGLVFEYLRTMIEAHRKRYSEQSIRLVLAGNGWHLVEAFSQQTGALGGSHVFNQHYEHIRTQLDDRKLTLSAPFLDVPTYKHLVAIGALDNASRMGGNELQARKPLVAQLPAGRGLEFREQNTSILKIEWSDLVGGQVPSTVGTSDKLRRLNSEVDFTDMPPLVGSWRSYVLEFFGVNDPAEIPLPDPDNLRLHLRESIPADNPPSLSKGPLQLIMETYGVEWLKK